MSKLQDALIREHRDIDAAIESFVDDLDAGVVSAESLNEALDLLRRHIYLEEAFLFPPIREGGMMMPILVMMREHSELWNRMDAVSALVATASGDRGRLVAACRELLALLDQHNGKEEPIVYPQVEVDLTAEAAAELERFLADGRLPRGWVSGDATP